MFISSIEIKGWRSYSDDVGIKLDELKRFNLIIGPNNSGKSNLQKFFRKLLSLNRMFDIPSTTPDIMLDNYTIGDKQPEESDRGHLNDQDFWNSNSPTFEAKIIFRNIRFEQQAKSSPRNFFIASKAFSIVAFASKDEQLNDWNPHGWRIKTYPLANRGNGFIVPFEKSLTSYKWLRANPNTGEIDWVDSSAHDNLKREAFECIRRFLKSFLFVDPIRHDSELREELTREFDGSAIIGHLYALSNDRNDRKEWRIITESIKRWLREVLVEEIVNVSFVDRELTFEVKRGNETKDQFFQHLGTGVLQAILLLCYLHQRKNDNLLVFLDEPENNLHAGATCRLVEILRREFSQHQFFICTHSPALMDMVDSDWAVFKTSFKPESGTTFTPCKSLTEAHGLLDDLGFRASQILQSNFVVWVEGPSDRIYVLKWIELVSDGTLREGVHFTFLYYGGAVLKHFGFGDLSFNVSNSQDGMYDKNLISFFSTSRYAAIVIDSDKINETSKDKPIVDTLRGRLEPETELGKSIMLWVTHGREIENYIPDRLWRTLESPEATELRRVKYSDTDNNEIKVQLSLPDQFMVSQFDDFARCLSNSYQAMGGIAIDEKANKGFKEFHDSKKVNMAKFFASDWKKSDIEGDPVLLETVRELISRIEKANGFLR